MTTLDSNSKENIRRIMALKNVHRGQSCFVVATGPSLNQTDLSLIKDKIIFGVNTLYNGFIKFGIRCDYYALSDDAVFLEHYEQIKNMDVGKLFLAMRAKNEYMKGKYPFINTPILMDRISAEPVWSGAFSKDLTKGTYWGFTVVIDVCLQVCWWMGFDTVYLLGCDHDYSGEIERFDGTTTETRAGGAVGEWEDIFKAHDVCKRVFEDAGRQIINCTVGGKLEVYQRKKLEDVIDGIR